MSRINYGAPGFFASGLSFLNAVLAYFMLPESLKERSVSKRRPAVFNIPAVRDAFRKEGIADLVLIFFFYTFSFSILYVAFPLFSEAVLKYDAADNGYFFAYVGLIGIIIQGGVIGKLAKKLGEKKLVIYGLVSFLASLLLVPEIHDIAPLVVIATLLAIGSAFITPSLSSLISKHAGTGEQGSTLGVSQSFSSLGRVLGPFFGGFILGVAGIDWPFYIGGFLILVAIVFAVRVPGRRVENLQSRR